MKYNTRKVDITDDFGGFSADSFCNVGAAVIGGSVISGLMGSNAASSAASTQANAANSAAAQQLQASREANAQQWKMYQQNMANQSPYLSTGQTALSALSSGLGLGGTQAYNPGGGGQIQMNQGGAPLATQVAAPTTNPDGSVNYGASQGALTNAANQYQGAFTKQFTPSDLTTDPSYLWRLQQGTQNLNASAAARGQLGSGQNLKDITNYGQGAASQEYSAAFDRYNTNQTNLYNRISSLAGLGQATATGMAAQGAGVASSMGANTMAGAAAAGNYTTSGAAAQAAGQVGQANAISGAIGSGLGGWNALQYQQAYTGSLGGGAPTPTNMTGFQTPAASPWGGTPAPAALGSGVYIP